MVGTSGIGSSVTHKVKKNKFRAAHEWLRTWQTHFVALMPHPTSFAEKFVLDRLGLHSDAVDGKLNHHSR